MGTKFLQYRIDSRNLIHFLKNTSKYNTSDLRDVVITRFLKNADKGFEDEQMLDLTEGEMYDIMSRRPEVQARKVMEVLIKWAKKRYADKKAEIEKAKRLEEEKKAEEKRLAEKRAEEDRIMEETRLREEKEAEEAKKKEEEKMEEDKVDGEVTKKEEDKKEETKTEEKKEESKEDDAKMDVDKKDDDKKDEKKDEKKEGEEKKEDEKKEEKKEEEKKSEEKKPEEKKDAEKKTDEKKTDDDDIVEIKKTETKPVEEKEEIDLTADLSKFVAFMKWDHTDAPYYLKEVRGHKIMSQEAQNEALTQMLQSFVDKQVKTPAQPASKETTSKIGPRSATTRAGGSPHAPTPKGQ